ncbi:MAG: hypothetical protein SH859_01610 [Hyphomicrobium aestuarii]|nr:hypothetical protein [Hyphomicrobium aestuarii]
MSVALRYRTSRAIVAAIIMAGATSGCGVRGNLEAPPAAKASGQPTRPDAADAAGSSTGKAEQQAHRPFILDGLIR